MWEFIFGLIPEKRQPGALSVLAFFSITLPILAAVAALAAWKLNDRLSRRPQLAVSPDRHTWTPNPAVEAETSNALQAAETVLRKTQDALHKTEDELRQTKQEAAKAIAAAGQRHITPAQKERFIKASRDRPVGPVGISAIENDAESKAYAAQIKELLEDAGYDVGEELGVIRLRQDTLIGLRVGVLSKESAPLHALPLAANFIDADISAFPVINQRIPAGAVEVTVGTNPAAMNDDLPPAPAPAKEPAKGPAEDPAPALPFAVATPARVPAPLPSPTPVKIATPPDSKEKSGAPKRSKP
ncbi:MAG TPA: hypothetical protein VGO11_11955 [Chthoniobacteraceae bacterium]|jgi:hypothetical protein|nr:hypothetical protein [Chthoniobacteraceae bacterium]